MLVCANPQADAKINISIRFYEFGCMRVTIEKPEEKRFKVSKYVVLEENLLPAKDTVLDINKTEGVCVVTHRMLLANSTFDEYKSEGECKYVFNLAPFRIQCYFNGNLALVINNRQLFNYEAYRDLAPMLAKAKDATDIIVPLYYWEQHALLHRAPCPRGPTSVALDYTFNGKSTR